jgi:hypothetical protein
VPTRCAGPGGLEDSARPLACTRGLQRPTAQEAADTASRRTVDQTSAVCPAECEAARWSLSECVSRRLATSCPNRTDFQRASGDVYLSSRADVTQVCLAYACGILARPRLERRQRHLVQRQRHTIMITANWGQSCMRFRHGRSNSAPGAGPSSCGCRQLTGRAIASPGRSASSRPLPKSCGTVAVYERQARQYLRKCALSTYSAHCAAL